MILQYLRIENFRQFHGNNELYFAHGNQNVTVLHGFNGSGKTALLNAIVWCLYGETTRDFEAPDQLISERALAEADIGDDTPVSVRISISDREVPLIIERRQIVKKEGDFEQRIISQELELWRETQNGDMESVGSNMSNKQKRINQMLPRDLYKFFFFNGERVEWLASEEAYKSVESGIKSLLDVEIYERSIKHLNDVDKLLSNELGQYGDASLQEALKQSDDLDKDIQEYEEKVSQKDNEIEQLAQEISDIENQELEVEKIAHLVEQRNYLRNQLKEQRDRLKDVRQDIAGIMSKDGYLVFAQNTFDSARRLIEDARTKGDLPAKIKPKFVDDLIDAGQCICGRDISSDEAAVAILRNWKSNAGLAEYEEAISQTINSISHLYARRADFIKRLDELLARRADIEEEIRGTKESLSTVEADIEGEIDEDELMRLRDTKRARQHDLTNAKADRKTFQDQKIQKQDEYNELQKKIRKLNVQDEKGQAVKRQRQAVSNVADVLQEIYDLQKQDVRNELDKRISEVWEDAAIKSYRATLTSDFKLQLVRDNGSGQRVVMGTSTGEKQVLALSFVGSLIGKALENSGEKGEHSASLPQGNEYPIVIDSAFGSLESDYRSKIAEWVPKLAPQVILLVSGTQWRDEVEEMVEPRVGRQYILELHTSKQGMDRSITVNGEKWPYVVSANDAFEKTALRRVK